MRAGKNYRDSRLNPSEPAEHWNPNEMVYQRNLNFQLELGFYSTPALPRSVCCTVVALQQNPEPSAQVTLLRPPRPPLLTNFCVWCFVHIFGSFLRGYRPRSACFSRQCFSPHGPSRLSRKLPEFFVAGHCVFQTIGRELFILFVPRGAGGSLWKSMERIISLASVQCMEAILTNMIFFNG